MERGLARLGSAAEYLVAVAGCDTAPGSAVMEKDRVAGSVAAAPGRLGVDLAVENPGVDGVEEDAQQAGGLDSDFRERLGIPACRLLGAVVEGLVRGRDGISQHVLQGEDRDGFRSHQHLFGVLVSLQLFECGGRVAQ